MEYKSKVFRYDDLNWSEAEVEKVKQEAESFRAEHNGTIELLNGHITRNSAFGPTLSYYAIPEHWPGLMVLWEEEDAEDLFPDCDDQCCGCERACADRIPMSENEDQGEEYELTVEYIYRLSVKYHAKSEEDAKNKAWGIAVSDDVAERIDTEGNKEIDYALCDAAGRTIIDWN